MTNDFLFFYKETKKYIHTAREMTFCPNLCKLPILGYPLLDGRQSAPV